MKSRLFIAVVVVALMLVVAIAKRAIRTMPDAAVVPILWVIVAALLIPGITGIVQRGKRYKAGELSGAHVSLCIGQVGSGTILLFYAAYVTWFQ